MVNSLCLYVTSRHVASVVETKKLDTTYLQATKVRHCSKHLLRLQQIDTMRTLCLHRVNFFPPQKRKIQKRDFSLFIFLPS